MSTQSTKPIIYLSCGIGNNVIISDRSQQADDFENNYAEIGTFAWVSSQEARINLLRNILCNAGVNVVIE